MQIVLVSSSYAPKVGGLETAVRQLARELNRRGHTITIVTNRYPRSLRSFDSIDGMPVYRLLMTDIFPSRAQLHRLPKYLLGAALMPIQLARLTRLMHSLNPTITNIHYLGLTAMYARLAKKFLADEKAVLSVHGSDLTTVPYPTGSYRMSRFVIRRMDALTACSHNLAHYLQKLMKNQSDKKIVVTSNGVDASEFADRSAYSHPRPYILTVGRLIEKKGMEVAIRAMKQIDDAGIELDLIIAGSGPLESSLRQLVAELALTEHVHFWGNANRRELAALLHGCTLFVLPSLWEAFGIASLEAMVCGKAVVASRCGGIPEIVRDGKTGCLVPIGDANALCRAILELQRDAARREAYGQCGREIALTEFNWQIVTNRYLQAYALA